MRLPTSILVTALSDVALAATDGNEEELWCNAVAAEVLIPLGALKSTFSGSLKAEELERLARHFKASSLVVIKRLYDGGLLSWESFQEVYDQEHARLLSILEKNNDPPEATTT